jgi:hypothetical protein
MDSDDPNLAMERSDKAAPRLVKSITDNALPTHIEQSDNDAPSLAKVRNATEDPSPAKSRTEKVAPNREQLLKANVDPK